MPKKRESKTESIEEGAVYVSSTGAYYSKPQIDAKKIRDCIRNNYLADQVGKLRSQIFTEGYAIEVRDPKGGIDQELQGLLKAMCDAKGVRLWSCMQQAWEDVWHWGCALFNPVWEERGVEAVLAKLRRLPPDSFATGPMDLRECYSEILQGIVLSEAGENEYWQTPMEMTLALVRLENVLMVKDPTSTELAGTSKIIPLVPLVTMLDFCWQAQMQKINRVGAPTIFIKVTNPVKSASRDDIAYANSLLKNWGKNTAFQLRENMEVVELDVTDNEAALATIDALKSRIREFFSPAALIHKEGPSLGGNAIADKELIDMWIEGQHQWMEDQFSAFPQGYLDLNGYEGYTALVRIGSQNVGVGDLEAKQAQVGYQTRSLSVNEIRRKLGEQELDEEGLAELEDEYARAQPPQQPGGFPYQFIAHDKEHAPTLEERSLDDRIGRLYEELEGKVAAALRHEGRA